MRILKLGLKLTAVLTLSLGLKAPVLAQSTSPFPLPTPPTVEISPDLFPRVTPLPPKPPVDPPVEQYPDPIPSVSPRPPGGQPLAAGQLQFAFPSHVMEGQKFQLQLTAQGQALNYPIKGQVIYLDSGYDLGQMQEEKVDFEITGPGSQAVTLRFRTAGRKTVRILADALPTRNARVFVQPFPATVFPRQTVGNSYSTSAADWQVWVNLHHSQQGTPPQQQYYLVTYKGDIIQKLLTSSATPGKITPQGQFKLGLKAASPRSTLYESVMPFWTTILVPGFSFEYGSHGLVGENYLYALGRPASHGCLRLSNKWIQKNGEWLNIGGAKWVYTHVPVGTSIHIFSKPAPAFAVETYRMWLSRQR